MIYTESRRTIERLQGDAKLMMIAEIYNGKGRLIAGLFEWKEKQRGQISAACGE